MINVSDAEKQLNKIIESNENYIKLNSPPGKKFQVIQNLSQIYITNAFIFMILNRLYKTKIKFNSLKYLDSTTKNINLFFLVWDNILDNSDYFEFNQKTPDFYQQIPNKRSIKNFFQLGLAIDQVIKLYKNVKNPYQLINFKKRNILLTLALLDIKKAYVESSPEYPDNTLYHQFFHLLKKEVIEYVDMVWNQHSLVETSKRQIKTIKDMIIFGEHISHFLKNFGDDEFIPILQKKINNWKKYLLKLIKFKSEKG